MLLIAVCCSLCVVVVVLAVILGFVLDPLPQPENLTEEEQCPNPEKN